MLDHRHNMQTPEFTACIRGRTVYNYRTWQTANVWEEIQIVEKELWKIQFEKNSLTMDWLSF
jgi:hypothetical protein